MFQAAKTIFAKLKATRLIIAQKLELVAEKITATAATVISVSTPLTIIDSSLGAIASLVLADGAHGQVKTIVMTGHSGTATITPTNLGNYGGSSKTAIAFTAVGQTWIGVFYGGQWHTIGTPTAGIS